VNRCVSAKTLSRHLDGDLPAPQAETVRRHVVECPDCAMALEALRDVEKIVRESGERPAETPDLATRVTRDLERRGAFFRARLAAGRRRLFGEGLLTGRMAVAVAVAAGLMIIGLAGTDRLTRDRWARQTAPVVADAERILLTLVRVDASDEARRLAWARQQARQLDLSARLAEARAGAKPTMVGDLAYLEAAFTVLADDRPLPADLHDQLAAGVALEHAAHLREALEPGG